MEFDRNHRSYRRPPPPFVNDMAEEEINARKYGPREKRRAAISINNSTGDISKFGPVTQPVQQVGVTVRLAADFTVPDNIIILILFALLDFVNRG
jgi:hypothetical protein